MANRSTEEYRARDDEDESLESLDHQDEKTFGKSQSMTDSYIENLQKKDPELLQEVARSYKGEIHHSEATWITQPHTEERTRDVESFKLLKESNAGKLFETMDAAFNEHHADILQQSDQNAVQDGVTSMVDGLTDPITQALDEFEKNHPAGAKHQVSSLMDSMRERDQEIHKNFRDMFSPLKPSDEDFAINIENLKDLSGDLSNLESRSKLGILGFGNELQNHDGQLIHEMDSMAGIKPAWDPERDNWTAPERGLDDVLDNTSWLKNEHKDNVIWRAFEATRLLGNNAYSATASREVVDLLFKPLSNEAGDLVERHRSEPDCIRDMEFGRPDKEHLEEYFNQRTLQHSRRAQASLEDRDREGFYQAMDSLRDTSHELQGARAGYLPSEHPGEHEWPYREALKALEHARENAESDTRAVAYLIVSLLGKDALSELPDWNGDMERTAESENFQEQTYDGLITNPDFLEKFREVTEGMLPGDQEQLVRYICERVDRQDDPEDLYEGLLYRAGEPRAPG